MAICRLIAPFGAYSGKIGAPDSQDAASAVVAMPDNDGRTLVRRYVTPANPDTTAQQQMRAFLTSISEAIQSLTQPQVDAWAAIAAEIKRQGRLGLDYTLSWTALFQMVNSYRLQGGLEIVTDPPELDSASGALNVTVTSDDGDPDPELTFAITANASTGRLFQIRITRDLGSPVRQARTNELRFPAVPDECIQAAGTGNPTLTLTATRLNTLSTQRIGVRVLAITPHYYPGGVLFAKNVLVGATP